MRHTKAVKLSFIFIFIFSVFLTGCSESIPAGECVKETMICPTCAPTSFVTVQSSATPLEMSVTETTQTDQPDMIIVYPRQVFEDYSEDYYTLDLEYPYMDGNEEAASNFNQIIDDLINNEISIFIDNVQNDVEFIEENMPGTSCSLYIDQDITGVFEQTISIRFQISYFIVGAAHPSHYSYSITYDVAKKRQIELSDLFISGSNYLNILSENSIDSLISNDYINNDSEWLKTGAAPKEENFKTWNITPDGILITYDPYQVAPYAAGFQEVVIPFSQFESIIDKNSLIRNIIDESTSNQ